MNKQFKNYLFKLGICEINFNFQFNSSCEKIAVVIGFNIIILSLCFLRSKLKKKNLFENLLKQK